MIWLFRILFVILFLVFFDVIYGLTGLLFLKIFDLEKHPCLYRAGLRFLAMSTILSGRFLPHWCELDCSAEKCGNWNCSNHPSNKKKA